MTNKPYNIRSSSDLYKRPLIQEHLVIHTKLKPKGIPDSYLKEVFGTDEPCSRVKESKLLQVAQNSQ